MTYQRFDSQETLARLATLARVPGQIQSSTPVTLDKTTQESSIYLSTDSQKRTEGQAKVAKVAKVEIERSGLPLVSVFPDNDPERAAIMWFDGRPEPAVASQARAAPRQSDALAGLPTAWRAALIKIDAAQCPASIPAERWSQTVVDARYLLAEWGHALHVTGWTLPDLFSAHRHKPLKRFDGMGLALLLQGRKVGPITDDRIGIHSDQGATPYFRRFNAAPAETVMLWELV